MYVNDLKILINSWNFLANPKQTSFTDLGCQNSKHADIGTDHNLVLSKTINEQNLRKPKLVHQEKINKDY